MDGTTTFVRGPDDRDRAGVRPPPPGKGTAPPPPGSWVTFTHRGFTAEGVPRFASFLRLRID